MTRIFLQKIYNNGIENIYECNIDDSDYVHFIHGKSNGISSNNIITIDEILGEFIIDFPRLKNIIKYLNYDNHIIYCDDKIEYNITTIENNIKINSVSKYENKVINEIIMSKKFLMDSYNILDTMWEDD